MTALFDYRYRLVSDVVEKVQKCATHSLYQLAQQMIGADDGISLFGRNGDQLRMRFVANVNGNFDELLGKTPKLEAVVDFENLTLVQDEELNAIFAIEGMVAAARNKHLPSFISFNTRLKAVLNGIRIDESNNPLDPLQITEAFKQALLAVDLSAKNNLLIYRRFNDIILKQLDIVLREANNVLIDQGVIPNMGIESGQATSRQQAAARAKPREAADAIGNFGMVETDPLEGDADNPELFNMMQNLLHREPTAAKQAPGQRQGQDRQQYAIPASLLPAGMDPDLLTPESGEAVQMVDQQQLLAILNNIQLSLKTRNQGQIPTDLAELQKLDINATLQEVLQRQREAGAGSAIDRQSSDIINLVSLLYDAIWKDNSVAIPIKELIGRTQVTIIKVALSDTTFFNRENHPARRILNEFAAAGIGWTEVDDLEQDPLYQKISQLVDRLLQEYAGDISLIDSLIRDFRQFRAREAARTHRLEQRIMRAKERTERLDDIQELVTRKIDERVLGRDLQGFVQELLSQAYHKFMVMLVLKEGPGSNAWKQAINTIDVLLWSVQPKDQPGDRTRLESVNPRLLNNLRKALRIAQINSQEVDSLLSQLQVIQEASLVGSQPLRQPQSAGPEDSDAEHQAQVNTEVDAATEPDTALAANDPALQKVDQLGVGVWVEFLGESSISIRCKLAAKINAIDKYIFVNRQGIKVVEKTRMGLALDIKHGTVKLISEGLLFSRALESVIGNLRESQQEQAGDAYSTA